MSALQPPSIPMPPVRPRTKAKSANALDAVTQVSKLVGERLRDFRRRQGHSLDTLARVSGVSRAMLGQIETGKSAPTVTLLWKIAKALGVPMSLLLAGIEGEKPYEVERKSAARILAATDGGFETRQIAPEDGAAGSRFLQLRVAPGHRERVAAYGAGRVSLVVGQGTIEIAIGDEAPVRLAQGDAIFFSSANKHVFSNKDAEESILYLVVSAHRVRGS